MQDLMLTLATKDKQEVVGAWLDQLGIKGDNLEWGEEEEIHSWGIGVPEPYPFIVGWDPAHKVLHIQTTLVISDHNQNAFVLMSPADRIAFLADLGVLLAGKGVEYMIGLDESRIHACVS